MRQPDLELEERNAIWCVCSGTEALALVGLLMADRTSKGDVMDGAKLYVGNLSYSVTNEELKELFSQYGEVKQANVIQGKGFGFIEMSGAEQAEDARKALNGSDFKGRALRIEEARPQKPRESKGYGKY
jgi:RNA recognition motif-containing protein